jgi:hypothetical protein
LSWGCQQKHTEHRSPGAHSLWVRLPLKPQVSAGHNEEPEILFPVEEEEGEELTPVSPFRPAKKVQQAAAAGLNSQPKTKGDGSIEPITRR